VTRFLIFFDININNVDSDQPLIWIAASDYSKGLFHEPRYYGQDYNTNMEGLFAVPLMWLKVPVYIAVPVATHFIFLTPYLFTAAYLFYTGKKTHALFVLAVLLCMPTAFDILTSIPRGFVTGLFFATFFILSLCKPHHKGYIILNSVFAIIGYFVNPNSIIISIPVLFYIFLHNYKKPQYYLVTAACLLLVIPLYLGMNKFYADHPEYIVYGLVYNFSLEHFVNNLSNLPLSWIHISFFSDRVPFALPATMLILAFFLWRQNIKAFYCFLLCILLVIISCFSGKTGDGTDWPFYSASRMYLALPLFLCIFFIFVPLQRILNIVFFATVICYSIYKFAHYNEKLRSHLKENLWVGVHIMPMASLLDAMNFYKGQCEKHNVDHFTIANAFWLSSYLAYGGPAIFPDYPQTMETNSERRYLVRERSTTKYVRRFMFLASKSDLDKTIETKAFKLRRLDDYGLFLVEDNKMSMSEFAITVRAAEVVMNSK
jgi:hypothetical protein